MKILVLGSENYANWIKGDNIFLSKELENVAKADLLLLTGGEDVDPSIYGEYPHHTTGSNINRDSIDITFYNKATKLHIPILGICRGSQFITAMQHKGRLVQNVTNHAIWGTHSITFNDDFVCEATSTHHQMMYPFNVAKCEILAWSTVPLSNKYEFGNEVKQHLINNIEPEIVYYPNVNALACQSHPEMMDKDCPLIIKLNEIIKTKLFNL